MFDLETHPAVADDGPQQVEFRASGSEYFRIWIVNVLLSIVTLGIYSAWAKVRREQYFHSSTVLAGSSFDYHGKPVAILKGRILALVLIGGYNLAFQYSPIAGACMGLLLAAVMPWLVWRSLQFRLYNTSYRGIRFGFGGSAGQAYLHFLALPLLYVVTFGLAGPFVHQRLCRFQFDNARFGTSRFHTDASVGTFYKVWLKTVLYAFGLMLAFAALGFVFKPAAGLGMGAGSIALLVLGTGLFYLALFALMQNALARLGNAVWNNATLEQHRFASSVDGVRLAFILLTNVLAVVCTLGLYTPFAVVRLRKYKAECMQVLVAGSLESFVAGVQQDVDATGEGAADLLDIDLAM